MRPSNIGSEHERSRNACSSTSTAWFTDEAEAKGPKYSPSAVCAPRCLSTCGNG